MDNPKFVASYCRLFETDRVGVLGDIEATRHFFRQFYKRFLRNPDVADLFRGTDMERQVDMLKTSLFHLIDCMDQGKPSLELAHVAMIHRQLGITPKALDEWMQALIETVEFMDPMCDEATKLAWCWAVSPGIFYMKSQLH